MIIVTLPGFVFFPLSAGFLIYRAFLWGMSFHSVPTWAFLLATPTLVLEGEAYVLAAAAGTLIGASWIRPKWVTDENLNRTNTLHKAFQEFLVFYILATVFLFTAAVVETATFTRIPQ